MIAIRNGAECGPAILSIGGSCYGRPIPGPVEHVWFTHSGMLQRGAESSAQR